MKQKITIVLLILSFILVACVPEPAAYTGEKEPAISLSVCPLLLPNGNQIDARCGTLTVPEDRSQPGGRTIPLNIVLVPAIKRSPEPDPVFLIAGGPGQSAVETFPAMIIPLYYIHEDRDIVLVDQRGTGKSNPLQCFVPNSEEVLTDEEALEQLKNCPDRLDADLRFYTTEIAMQDLDEVRAALGYEKINLYGASYGTRAALTYLRLFPDRVRTITLDAVVDPNFIMYMDAASDAQHALDLFFERCEADEACRETFPGLKDQLDQLLSRLDAQPQEITIPHPLTHKPLTLTVNRRLITEMIFGSLYSPDLTATLPVAIQSAAVDNNFTPLISQAYMLDAGIYQGMFYAVTCAEDAPLLDETQSERQSIFFNRVPEFASICDSWPQGSVSADFRKPFSSDVPALILSGEADPITPPWHAASLADMFSSSVHVVFKGMGHSNLTNTCSIKLFETFLTSASSSALDTSCVADIQPPPFFVDFNGPRP